MCPKERKRNTIIDHLQSLKKEQGKQVKYQIQKKMRKKSVEAIRK